MDRFGYAEARCAIEDYVASSELVEAAKLTMDLRRNYFPNDQGGMRKAVLLNGQIRKLLMDDEVERRKPNPPSVEYLDSRLL